MSALPPKADIAVGKESSLKKATQAQLGLDNRQFELCALQPCSSPGGIADVIVSYSALGGRYPVSCAVQVANGVLPRLGPRAFLPWSFSRRPGGNDRSELLPGRHSAFVATPLHRPLCERPHDGGAPMKSRFPISTPYWRMMS
jgi:hypothetical protein